MPADDAVLTSTPWARWTSDGASAWCASSCGGGAQAGWVNALVEAAALAGQASDPAGRRPHPVRRCTRAGQTGDEGLDSDSSGDDESSSTSALR